MSLSSETIDQVLVTCRQNAAEVCAALGRALGLPFEADAEKIGPFEFSPAGAEWQEAGLAVVVNAQDQAALVLLTGADGLLPEWVQNPDAEGKSKLAALAREVGLGVLTGAVVSAESNAEYLPQLSEAIARANLDAASPAIQIPLRSGEATPLLRILPMAPVEKVVPQTPPPEPLPADTDPEEQLRELPGYIQSLLRISVPVSVQLAASKQPVSRILGIGPGSIIQFDKNCEKPITLYVGEQPVAEGEAVKVGEKFGIKLTAMVLPGEKFVPLRGKHNRE